MNQKVVNKYNRMWMMVNNGQITNQVWMRYCMGLLVYVLKTPQIQQQLVRMKFQF